MRNFDFEQQTYGLLKIIFENLKKKNVKPNIFKNFLNYKERENMWKKNIFLR